MIKRYKLKKERVKMKSNPKIETEEYHKEIRKLEVRLEEYLQEEENFVKNLRKSIVHLKALQTEIEQIPVPISAEKAEEITKLKTEAIDSLSEALKSEGFAEHEKSHLLESYGALLLALHKIEIS
jgi:hypothetical protein